MDKLVPLLFFVYADSADSTMEHADWQGTVDHRLGGRAIYPLVLDGCSTPPMASGRPLLSVLGQYAAAAPLKVETEVCANGRGIGYLTTPY